MAKPARRGGQLLQTPTYVVRARLGTLPQQLLLAVDTSNDAAWIPCAGCVGCPTSSAPPFDPAASTSYRSLPCGSPLCVQAPNAACPPGGKASRTPTPLCRRRCRRTPSPSPGTP